MVKVTHLKVLYISHISDLKATPKSKTLSITICKTKFNPFSTIFIKELIQLSWFLSLKNHSGIIANKYEHRLIRILKASKKARVKVYKGHKILKSNGQIPQRLAYLRGLLTIVLLVFYPDR